MNFLCRTKNLKRENCHNIFVQIILLNKIIFTDLRSIKKTGNMSASEQTRFITWKSYLSFTLSYFRNQHESSNRNIHSLCLDDGFKRIFNVTS